MAGEPVDRLDVEVVGRLVEQQQVEVVEQQRGQRDAAALATGEASDRSVEVEIAEQVVDDVPRRAASAAHSWSARSPSTTCPTVSLGIEVVVLGERCPTVSPRFCVTRPASAGSSPARMPQQGRLAVAVASDDADPVAVLDAEADVGEQRPHAVRLGHLLQR